MSIWKKYSFFCLETIITLIIGDVEGNCVWGFDALPVCRLSLSSNSRNGHFLGPENNDISTEETSQVHVSLDDNDFIERRWLNFAISWKFYKSKLNCKG